MIITVTIEAEDGIHHEGRLIIDVEVADGVSPQFYDLLARRLHQKIAAMPEVTDATLCR